MLAGGACLWAQAPKEDAAAIYKRQCAGCHGPDGRGQTSAGKSMKVPDLTSTTVQNQTDAQLFDEVARGKGRMPAYESRLGQNGVKEVVAYLRQIAKTEKKK